MKKLVEEVSGDEPTVGATPTRCTTYTDTKEDRMGTISTPEQCIARIRDNKDLLNQMIGTLYPSIVMQEIIDLRQRYYALTKQHCPV